MYDDQQSPSTTSSIATSKTAHRLVQGGTESSGGEPVKPAVRKTAKSVGHNASDDAQKKADERFREVRMTRFRHQRHAAALLDYKQRVGLCKMAMIDRAAGVDVYVSEYQDKQTSQLRKRGSLEGLQTCESVWHCPCCSAHISEVRRREMNDVFSWARTAKLSIKMVTLTARHGAKDDLATLLDAIKRAKKAWHQHRTYKGIKGRIVGHITATEVTGGGRNGWHPHYHIIFLLDESDGPVDLEDLREPWVASLRGAGLSGAGAAYQVQDASQAQTYITKWGAAEEMTLSGQKRGRGAESRTPAQLLADSCDAGDKRAGALWRQYGAVFKGRRQLVWSKGLKQLAGIGEVSEADASAGEGEKPEEQVTREHVGNIPSLYWNDMPHRRGACRRRGLLLNAAETEGQSGVFRETYSGAEDPVPDDDIGSLIEDD